MKPVRLAALRVACPKCGSGPMVACNGKKGKRKAVHRDRIAVSCAAVSPKLVAARPDAGGFYQSPAWRRLRYEAIRLHGGRCQCCGATARTGTSLHVDHIKPRSRHPDLELSLSNLQVLCEDCNLGKGAHDQTDWRRA